MQQRINVHPGWILELDFMHPMGLSALSLAQATGLSLEAIEAIIAGRQHVTRELDRALGHYFGTSDGYWLRLQAAYDAAASTPAPGHVFPGGGAYRPRAAACRAE